jgi:hypothetical protein
MESSLFWKKKLDITKSQFGTKSRLFINCSFKILKSPLGENNISQNELSQWIEVKFPEKSFGRHLTGSGII